MNTYDLACKGFKYVGCYSINIAKTNRYGSVLQVQRLADKLSDKQYAYTDSERALLCIVSRLGKYRTVRAIQCSPVSWLVAWSKATPKLIAKRVLYTDIDGAEYDWS